MKRLHIALLVAMALQLGCAADGGPVGTGIASGISGNVIEVESGSSTTGSTSGVQVSLQDDPSITTTTDADGNFELSGDFAGPVTVRFTTPEYSTDQLVDVPDGATVLMRDLIVRQGMLELPPPSVLGFYGQIAMVDCSGDTPTILVNDRRPMPNQVMVQITATTDIVRGNGEALTCNSLSVGTSVAIQGALSLRDRTMVAVTITVGPPPPGTPSPVRSIHFRGPILVINCAQGQALLGDEQRTRLRLEPTTTRIHTPQGMMLRCSDLRTNDTIDGIGEVTTRRPGVVTATDIIRQAVASQ